MFKPHSRDWKRGISKRKPCFHMEFWKSNLKFAISEPENPRVQSCAKIVEFQNFMSAILDPPFWKMEIRCQICNQRLQQPRRKKFHESRWVSKILCPPYWVRHFEFRKTDVKFIISDPKSFWVQSFAKIVWFPKLHVRHIGYPPFCEGYGYLRSVTQFCFL